MSISTWADFRIGQGWDSHRIEAGRPLILAGVVIPSDIGLAGHSDADVLFHAVTDAILGALALGDIGMHFPDSSVEWKGAQSVLFLRHALQLAANRGYRPVNVDSTIILQRPKLKDFREAIRDGLASGIGLPPESVGVKFKTAEGVGPVGEGRSCEAQAVVLLVAAPG